MITAKQVQSDIIALLEGSELAAGVTGRIYRGTPDGSYRPRDSRLEDLIVIFTSGEADEIETGTVTLNIYVPDIDIYGDGVLGEDGARTAEVEEMAAAWVESLTAGRSNYKFRLSQTIYTQREEDLRQHFVVVKLAYRHYGGQRPPETLNTNT